jgi:hypothetical protein
VLAQFLEDLFVAMTCVIVTKKNRKFLQAPTKSSVTFDSRNQCITKRFNEIVSSHVQGVDYLDLEINGLSHSIVENHQDPAIRG